MRVVGDWEGDEIRKFVVVLVIVVDALGTAAWLDERRHLMYRQRPRAAETVSAAAAACYSVCDLLC